MFAMLASDRWWPDFCNHVGRSDLIDDPRFSSAAARTENSVECIGELQQTFSSATLKQWRERLARLLGPWEVVQNSLEVNADAQAQENGYIASIPHPNGVDVTAVRTPVQFDGAQHDIGVAPDAWQHTEEVLLELGHDWDRIIELKELGAIP
jgi:crotonobetainyl-CoA:carnitine CoA-transferase CaiB-like acyl-CoA transferase